MKAPETGPPLENYANNAANLLNLTAPGRSGRYARRAFLWKMSDLARVRKCGRVTHTPDGIVSARERDGVTSMHGIVTCASLWACPVCNAKIMARRGLEIQCAVALAQAQGLHPAFMTLTMRHHLGQTLGDLWDGIAAAWRKVTSSGSFIRNEALQGYVKVTEVTHGRNGWHVHLHVLLFLQTQTPEYSLRETAGTMWRTWSTALPALGFSDPLLEAQDWKLLEGPADSGLSTYLTKAVDQGAIHLELTSSQTKGRTHLDTATPWELLSLSAGGDAHAFRLWGEWERSSKGRRQISWSRHLRSRLGLGQEETDEEIALRDDTSTEDDVLYLLPNAWKQMTQRPHLIAGLLDQPRHLMSTYLTEQGIAHHLNRDPR